MPTEIRHIQLENPTVPQTLSSEQVSDNQWRPDFYVHNVVERDYPGTEKRREIEPIRVDAVLLPQAAP